MTNPIISSHTSSTRARHDITAILVSVRRDTIDLHARHFVPTSLLLRSDSFPSRTNTETRPLGFEPRGLPGCMHGAEHAPSPRGCCSCGGRCRPDRLHAQPASQLKLPDSQCQRSMQQEQRHRVTCLRCGCLPTRKSSTHFFSLGNTPLGTSSSSRSPPPHCPLYSPILPRTPRAVPIITETDEEGMCRGQTG